MSLTGGTQKGKGRAGGAITVVNAIPAGKGATIGTALGSLAEARVAVGAGTVRRSDQGPSGLVEACYAVMSDHLGEPLHGEARVRGPPEGRGLKSSHSVALALLDALANATGTGFTPHEHLTLAVGACEHAGVTRTGGWDDAAGCLGGGLVATSGSKVVLHEDIETLDVLLLVPCRQRLTSETPSLEMAAQATRAAFEMTLDGSWADAMTSNGRAICMALQEDLTPSEEALRAGAIAAGLSGTGPAMAAVVRPDRTDHVERILGMHGTVLRTTTRPREVDLCQT